MTETSPPYTSHQYPDIEARLRENFEKSGLMKHLGAHLGEILPGEVHVHLPYRAALTQSHGYFHAGATTAVADTAGGLTALSLFNPGESVLSVEFKINLIAPAQGESLEAIGRVVRAGRTLTTVQVEVYGVEPGKKTQVALMQQTLIRLPAA